MDRGTLAALLVLAGLVGLAIAFLRNERAQRARERRDPAPSDPAPRDAGAQPAPSRGPTTTPRVLRLSVVDIGAMRYFDVRTFPLDAFVGRVPSDAAKNAIRGREPAAAHVWVMPRGYERWLGELTDAALVIALSRLKDPAGSTGPRTFVWIEGWRAMPGKLDAIARELGVELLVELPRLLEPERAQAGLPERSVLAMLDEAAARAA